MEPKGKHSLDDLFRRGFENEESTPPSAAWAQMESLLDAQQSGGEDKKKRRAVAWYWAAAAVVLPFLLAGFWWIKSGNSESQLAQSSTPSVVEQPKVETTATTSSTEKTAAPAPKTEAVLQNDGFQNKKPVTGNTMIAAASPKAGNKQKAKTASEFVPSEERQIADNQIKNTNSLQQANRVVSSQQAPDQKVANPNPVSITEVAQATAKPEEESGNEIASIEYRSSAKANDGPEVAVVEWKKENRVKRSLGEQIARIKAGDLGKLPNLDTAKDQLVAFLGIK